MKMKHIFECIDILVILDGVCYLVILLFRVTLSRMMQAPVFSLRRVSWSTYEYFCSVTPIDVPLYLLFMLPDKNMLFTTSPQDS